MAEEIRRRVAALRLAAYLAIALTIAGIGTTRTPIRPVSAAGVPANSVGSRQVVDGSLQTRDLKAGSVLTPQQAADRYLKIGTARDTYLDKQLAADTYLDKQLAADTYLDKQLAADTYLDKERAADTYLKSTDAQATYLKLGTEIDAWKLGGVAAADYLKTTDADARYIKMNAEIDAHKLGGIPASGFVQGDGSVRTGLVLLDGDATKPLMDLPGIAGVTVERNADTGPSLTLQNLSGGRLVVSSGGKSSVVDDKGSTGILIGLDQPTLVQLIALDTGIVSTLSISASGLGGGSTLFAGQALVGR